MNELWKEYPNKKGEHFCFMVSTTGKIRKVYPKGIIIRPKISESKGYLLAFSKAVHRYVAETFIPNPLNKLYVNHKDGNKKNNHVSNLEWVTAKENTQHALKIGLIKSGENGCKSIITNWQAIQIRKRAKFGMTGADIARIMQLNKQSVYNIINNNTYKYVKANDI